MTGYEPVGSNGVIEVVGGTLALQANGEQRARLSRPIRFTGATDDKHLQSWMTDCEFAGPIYYNVDFRPNVSINGKMVFSGGVTGDGSPLVLTLQRENVNSGSGHPQLIITNKPWISSGVVRSWGGDPGKDGHRPEVVFAVSSNNFLSIGYDDNKRAWGNTDIRFGADMAFYYDSMPVYVQNMTLIDLAGTKQQFGTFKMFDIYQDGTHPVVSNSTVKAGTLCIAQTSSFTQQGTFGGNLNVSFGGTAVTTLGLPSTATGNLEVTGGTLAFTEDASWLGATNVTVSGSSATLSVTHDGILSRKMTLNLDEGGRLDIASGLVQETDTLLVDGIRKPNGRYTAASHPELVTGEGVLYVNDGKGTLIIFK